MNELEQKRLASLYTDNFLFADTEDWELTLASALASKDAFACITLVVAMSEVSEEYDCSTWHTGLEDTLAEYASNMSSCVENRNRFCQVTRSEMLLLLELAEKCGGWWEWTEDQKRPTFVPGWIPPGVRP